MYPMKLKPVYDKTIWANDRLTTMRGMEEKGLGTCWEISAHPHAKNVILNGEYAGKTLDELIQRIRNPYWEKNSCIRCFALHIWMPERIYPFRYIRMTNMQERMKTMKGKQNPGIFWKQIRELRWWPERLRRMQR